MLNLITVKANTFYFKDKTFGKHFRPLLNQNLSNENDLKSNFKSKKQFFFSRFSDFQVFITCVNIKI